jgi:transposase-like protein
MEIKVPRDRNGDFEPLLIGKNQTRFADMDEKMAL